MFIRAIKSKIITMHGVKPGAPVNKTVLPSDAIQLASGNKKLLRYLFASLKKYPLKDGDILVITSKALAITQGRVAKINNQKEFQRLVKAEADHIIGGSKVTLTLKDGIFIPWAGIDRSNIPKGYAVLWPQKSFTSAWQLRRLLMKNYRLKKLGVIISDSHCIPLRKGVVGIALGYAGFKGVNDLRGKKDLYGNKLKVTQQAIADMLATSANLLMGEGCESTPFAIISSAPVIFTSSKTKSAEPVIDPADCLFLPMYKGKIT